MPRRGEAADLDGVERTLDAEDVVIADESGAIAMAGVMGGATTEVSAETTRVLLESATFDPVRVFRTGKRHKLSSEAAKRFERTVDPEITAIASARAAQLIVEIAGGTQADAWTDVRIATDPVPAIKFAPNAPDDTAGVYYPAGTSGRRLREVGCTVDEHIDGLTVRPPSWRPDLRESADLVEEVLRLEGSGGHPRRRAPRTRRAGITPVQRRRRSIGRTLALDGYVEVLPYPFMPAGVFDVWGFPTTIRGARRSASSTRWSPTVLELNTTLLPGLLEMVVRNLARGQRFRRCSPSARWFSVVLAAARTSPHSTSPTALRRRAGAPGRQPPRPAGARRRRADGVVRAGGPWGRGRPADATDAFEAARSIGRAAGIDVELVADDKLPWHRAAVPGSSPSTRRASRLPSAGPASCTRRVCARRPPQAHVRPGTLDRRVAAGRQLPHADPLGLSRRPAGRRSGRRGFGARDRRRSRAAPRCR